MKANDDKYGLTAAQLRASHRYNPLTGVFTLAHCRGRWPAGTIVGRLRKDGYIDIGIGKKRYMAQRLAWLYVYGEWPTDEVDHRNRIRSQNNIDNLRLGTHSQNMANNSGHKGRKSKYVGVTYRKTAGDLYWVAQIKHQGVMYYGGSFPDQESAHQARLALERVFHGEYSRTASGASQ